MYAHTIPSLSELYRALINSVDVTRIYPSRIYNAVSDNHYGQRLGSFLQTAKMLPAQLITIDAQTKSEAQQYCTNLPADFEYYPDHNLIDELYHWITNYSTLETAVATGRLEELLIPRLEHPILVYSMATQYIVTQYHTLYGLTETKHLLTSHSCIKWNKTCSAPIRKWGRVYLNRTAGGLSLHVWPAINFADWVTQYYTPEQEYPPENFLQNYSSKATSTFDFKYGTKPAYKLALGVELELENLTKKAIPILKETLGKHAIFKRDGSVSAGVEICTAPATLDLHKEAFKVFFEKDSGLTVKENCGLHVHVDRKGLEKTQIPKILMFMNDSNNNDLIERIAGRKANNYCHKKEYNWTSAILTNHTDKYSRVNLAPPDTIEFRLFAATMDIKQFSRCLEFVQAVVDYTKSGEYNCSIKDIVKAENFLSYLKKNQHFYPELNRFIHPQPPKV
jgi:hypothetical protein